MAISERELKVLLGNFCDEYTNILLAHLPAQIAKKLGPELRDLADKQRTGIERRDLWTEERRKNFGEAIRNSHRARRSHYVYELRAISTINDKHLGTVYVKDLEQAACALDIKPISLRNYMSRGGDEISKRYRGVVVEIRKLPISNFNGEVPDVFEKTGMNILSILLDLKLIKSQTMLTLAGIPTPRGRPSRTIALEELPSPNDEPAYVYRRPGEILPDDKPKPGKKK